MRDEQTEVLDLQVECTCPPLPPRCPFLSLSGRNLQLPHHCPPHTQTSAPAPVLCPSCTSAWPSHVCPLHALFPPHRSSPSWCDVLGPVLSLGSELPAASVLVLGVSEVRAVWEGLSPPPSLPKGSGPDTELPGASARAHFLGPSAPWKPRPFSWVTPHHPCSCPVLWLALKQECHPLQSARWGLRGPLRSPSPPSLPT